MLTIVWYVIMTFWNGMSPLMVSEDVYSFPVDATYDLPDWLETIDLVVGTLSKMKTESEITGSSLNWSGLSLFRAKETKSFVILGLMLMFFYELMWHTTYVNLEEDKTRYEGMDMSDGVSLKIGMSQESPLEQSDNRTWINYHYQTFIVSCGGINMIKNSSKTVDMSKDFVPSLFS